MSEQPSSPKPAAGKLEEIELYDSGSTVEDDGLWSNPVVTFPDGRRQRMVRVDMDVFEWFKSMGHDFEFQISEVLRSHSQTPRQGNAHAEPAAGEALENPIVTYPGGLSQRMVRVDEDVFEAVRRRYGDEFEWRINDVLRTYSQVPRKQVEIRGKHAG